MSFHLMVYVIKHLFYCVLFINDVIDDREGRQGINDHLPKGLKS